VAVANSAGPTPAPPPTGYEKGRTYTFVFTITADVRPDENFILTPQMSNGWTARMVGDSEIPIRAARDSRTPTVGTVSVTVQIPGTANDGDTGDLTLTVESKRNAAIKDRSQEVKITVGGAAQAPRTMAVSLIGTAGLDAAMRVNADGTKTGFATAGGTNGGEFLLEVHAPAAGAYKVDTTKLAKFLSDPTPAKWSATVSGSATGQVTLVAGRNTVPVTVAALTGAQPAKLVFEIVSNANPNESGYFELAVEPM
jgi:hypothetical protein